MHGEKISALPEVTRPAEALDPELGCPTWSPLAHTLTVRAVRSGCCVRLWEAGLMGVGQPSRLLVQSSNKGSKSALYSVQVALSVPFRDIPVSGSSLSLVTVLRMLIQWDPRGNLAQSLCGTYEKLRPREKK